VADDEWQEVDGPRDELVTTNPISVLSLSKEIGFVKHAKRNSTPESVLLISLLGRKVTAQPMNGHSERSEESRMRGLEISSMGGPISTMTRRRARDFSAGASK
jgi:hypothetical protein